MNDWTSLHVVLSIENYECQATFFLFVRIFFLRTKPIWRMSVGMDSHLSSISAVSTDLKRHQTPQCPHSIFRDQVWVQVQAWQLLLKAFPEDNWRFWMQSQWLSSWGSTLAQVGLVWLASMNIECFWVCCSHCWFQEALLRNKGYCSCFSELESQKKALLLWILDWQIFFPCVMKFSLFFFLPIFQWSLSELVVYQSRAHCFAKSYHSLASQQK